MDSTSTFYQWGVWPPTLRLSTPKQWLDWLAYGMTWVNAALVFRHTYGKRISSMRISSEWLTKTKHTPPLEHCGLFNTLSRAMDHKGRFWVGCFNT